MEANVYIGTNRDFEQLSLVEMVIADFAKKVGGTDQLGFLLQPGCARFNREGSGAGGCSGHPACTKASTVEFYDEAFTYSTQQTKDLVDHELAHVIDTKSAYPWGPLTSSVRFSSGYDTSNPLISDYATTNWREYWAEAVGDFVYGEGYYGAAPGRGPIDTRIKEFLISALIGTGW
jgi:hypothetical protein